MIETLAAIFDRFIESYRSIWSQILGNRSVIIKILSIPLFIFIYSLTLMVILTVFLMAIFIAVPTSVIYGIFSTKS